jgi:hypothetical protein
VIRNRKNSFFHHNLYEYALFAILLFSFLILSTRLATFLHEVIGHGLITVLLGGKCHGIHISPWGGGYANCELKAEAGISFHFLHNFGGIILNLTSGLISFFISHKSKMTINGALFLAIFGLISILGAYSYLIVGSYYNVGDPAGWIPSGIPARSLFFLFLFSTTPILAYYTFSTYLTIQEKIFPSTQSTKRLMKCFITLGFSVFVYSLFFIFTSQSLIILDAPKISYEISESNIRQKKREKVVETILKDTPDISREELNHIMKHTEIVVGADEVPKKFPIIPVVVFLCFIGFLFANYEKKTVHKGMSKVPLSGKVVLANILTAICVVSILSHLD